MMKKGCDKVQLLPDVLVQEHLVDEETAKLGAVSVLELIDKQIAKPRSEFIWEIYLDEYKQDSTLPEAFTRCADAILKFAGVSYMSTRVSIMNLGDAPILPMHQDIFEGSRSLLTLAGFKDVRFAHPELEAAHTQVSIGPGDAYTMTFRNDDTSLEHEVEYCFGDNIVIYVDHD